MLRSLYSGVSGMKNLQTKMDVVSNNIANVNTVGFKSSRITFQDIMSQTVNNATAPGNGLGGINSNQVGLGVQTGAITTVHSVGAPQTTGRELDFYITGSGYFMVKGAGTDVATSEKFYTRDGAFLRDSEGNITTTAGMKLLGYVDKNATNEYTGHEYVDGFNPDDTTVAGGKFAIPVPPADPMATLGEIKVPSSMKDAGGNDVAFQSMSIDGNGLVLAQYGGKTYVMGRVPLATFNNAEGLDKAGGNTYTTSGNSGSAIIAGAGANGSGQMRSGTLEMSNVDLATEFTEMIIANRAYQANSRSITTSDEMLQELINLKR